MDSFHWFPKRTQSAYLIIFFIVAVNSSCPYFYVEQPPESPFCDPFGAFNLELKCTVCADSPTNFSVGWYRDEEPLDMTIDNSQRVGNDSSGNAVQCIESRLKIQGAFLSTHYGTYFCSIEQDLRLSSLQPSRSIRLTSTAGQHCQSGMLFVDNLYSCAVITSPTTTVDPLDTHNSSSSEIPTLRPEASVLPNPDSTLSPSETSVLPDTDSTLPPSETSVLPDTDSTLPPLEPSVLPDPDSTLPPPESLPGQLTTAPEASMLAIPNSALGHAVPTTLIWLISTLTSIMGVAALQGARLLA